MLLSEGRDVIPRRTEHESSVLLVFENVVREHVEPFRGLSRWKDGQPAFRELGLAKIVDGFYDSFSADDFRSAESCLLKECREFATDFGVASFRSPSLGHPLPDPSPRITQGLQIEIADIHVAQQNGAAEVE